jgi:hypothetical protein
MKKLLWGVTLTVFAALLCAPAHAGPVTYTYTGNPFTMSSPNFVNFTSISGSFTLSSALGDNFKGDVTPTSFSFDNGGGVFISSADANIEAESFYVVTNGSGVITNWIVQLQACIPNCSFYIETFNVPGQIYDAVGYFTDYAENSNDPGTWSESGATPEPSSLLLLGTGLLGLGPLIRSRLSHS